MAKKNAQTEVASPESKGPELSQPAKSERKAPPDKVTVLSAEPGRGKPKTFQGVYVTIDGQMGGESGRGEVLLQHPDDEIQPPPENPLLRYGRPQLDTLALALALECQLIGRNAYEDIVSKAVGLDRGILTIRTCVANILNCLKGNDPAKPRTRW